MIVTVLKIIVSVQKNFQSFGLSSRFVYLRFTFHVFAVCSSFGQILNLICLQAKMTTKVFFQAKIKISRIKILAKYKQPQIYQKLQLPSSEAIQCQRLSMSRIKWMGQLCYTLSVVTKQGKCGNKKILLPKLFSLLPEIVKTLYNSTDLDTFTRPFLYTEGCTAW